MTREEAKIIAEAEINAVTIATNMAGRRPDIKLEVIRIF